MLIPASFPFTRPAVRVRHDRFAGLPYVLFGRQICLYHSDADWNPADGMFGVIARLAAWYRRAAAGRLVEAGQPLHPPVAYRGFDGADCVVIRPDLPRDFEPSGAVMVGAVSRASRRRGVAAPGGARPRQRGRPAAACRNELGGRGEGARGAGLPRRGQDPARPVKLRVPRQLPGSACCALGSAGQAGGPDGTARARLARERASRGAHGRLRVAPCLPRRADAGMAREPTPRKRTWRCGSSNPAEAVIPAHPHTAGRPGRRTGRLASGRAQAGARAGCGRRPSPGRTSRRRGRRSSPAGTRAGRRSGCSARTCSCWAAVPSGPGSPSIASARECAGSSSRTAAAVGPGDAGPAAVRGRRHRAAQGAGSWPSAWPRSGRLGSRCGPELGDIRDTILGTGRRHPEADLIVDATASRGVSARIEWLRRTQPGRWPPMLTVGVGHACERAVGALALPHASGGGADILHSFADQAVSERSAAGRGRGFFRRPRSRRHLPARDRLLRTDVHRFRPGGRRRGRAGVRLGPARPERLRRAPPGQPEVAVPRAPAGRSRAGLRTCTSNGRTTSPPTTSGAVIRSASVRRPWRGMRAEALATARRYPALLGDRRCPARLLRRRLPGGMGHRRRGAAARQRARRARLPARHRRRGATACGPPGGKRRPGPVHRHVAHAPGHAARASQTDDQAMRNLLVPLPTAQVPRRAVQLILGGEAEGWDYWLQGAGRRTSVSGYSGGARFAGRPPTAGAGLMTLSDEQITKWSRARRPDPRLVLLPDGEGYPRGGQAGRTCHTRSTRKGHTPTRQISPVTATSTW